MTDAITSKILEIIVREGMLKEVDLNPSDRLEDLDIQSLDMTLIIFGLEEEFGIDIPEDTSLMAGTVQDVIDHLQELITETKPVSS